MNRKTLLSAALLPALYLVPSTAQAEVLGGDAAACTGNKGPAVLVNVSGLKDRIGKVKLEMYPANDDDFLEKDRILIAEGKFFRRVTADTPQSGAVSLCIRAAKPGRYGLVLLHERSGSKKFSPWKDGAGVPGNKAIGMSAPKIGPATIDVGPGITVANIKMQYLRGLGFSPAK